MKTKCIDKIFSRISLLVIVIISIICNIGDFTSGSGKINPLTLIVTFIYIIYGTAFTLLAKNRKSVTTMTIWSIVTLVVAILSFLTSTFRLTIGAIIPFSIVFLTPFQGLVAILSSNWIIIYSIIIFISILWVVFSILNIRRHHKNNETTQK